MFLPIGWSRLCLFSSVSVSPCGVKLAFVSLSSHVRLLNYFVLLPLVSFVSFCSPVLPAVSPPLILLCIYCLSLPRCSLSEHHVTLLFMPFRFPHSHCQTADYGSSFLFPSVSFLPDTYVSALRSSFLEYYHTNTPY